jgi:hypothetical protein
MAAPQVLVSNRALAAVYLHARGNALTAVANVVATQLRAG